MLTTKMRYPKEFKERAVQLSQESGKSVKEVAAELEISSASLSNWRRKAGVASPRKGPEAEELRSLKQKLDALQRENKQLQKEKKLAEMERDILKKATALFARDSR